MRNACRIFVSKLEMKRPLGRPRHRWEDNVMELTRDRFGLDASGSG